MSTGQGPSARHLANSMSVKLTSSPAASARSQSKRRVPSGNPSRLLRSRSLATIAHAPRMVLRTSPRQLQVGSRTVATNMKAKETRWRRQAWRRKYERLLKRPLRSSVLPSPWLISLPTSADIDRKVERHGILVLSLLSVRFCYDTRCDLEGVKRKIYKAKWASFACVCRRLGHRLPIYDYGLCPHVFA